MRLHLAPIAQSGSEQVRCHRPGQTHQPYRFQSVQFCLETRAGGGLARAASMAALRAVSLWRSSANIRAAILPENVKFCEPPHKTPSRARSSNRYDPQGTPTAGKHYRLKITEWHGG
jgi:hypothetical protein